MAQVSDQPTVVSRDGVAALLRAAVPSLPGVSVLPGIRKDTGATDPR